MHVSKCNWPNSNWISTLRLAIIHYTTRTSNLTATVIPIALFDVIARKPNCIDENIECQQTLNLDQSFFPFLLSPVRNFSVQNIIKPIVCREEIAFILKMNLALVRYFSLRMQAKREGRCCIQQQITGMKNWQEYAIYTYYISLSWNVWYASEHQWSWFSTSFRSA